MSGEADWYSEHMSRTDFLGHVEPRRNDGLHAHTRSHSILTFPRAESKPMLPVIDRIISAHMGKKEAAQ